LSTQTSTFLYQLLLNDKPDFSVISNILQFTSLQLGNYCLINYQIMKKIFLVAVVLTTFAIAFTACKSNDSKAVAAQSTNATTEQLAKDEMYTCTMHNEVMSDHPGDCPKCRMKLVMQEMTASQEKMMKEGTYVKPKE
jgi:hypothetical protein